MKNKRQIENEMEFCKEGMIECEGTDDAFIYQGWVEALEWVLAQKE